MERLLNNEKLNALIDLVWSWINNVLLSIDTAGQFLAIVLLSWFGLWVGTRIRTVLDELGPFENDIFEKTRAIAHPLHKPFWALIMLLVGSAAASAAELPDYLINISTSLLTAWLVITMASNFIAKPQIAKLVAFMAWSLAALDILNLLDPAITALENASINLGESRITAIGVIWGIATFIILIYAAIFISRMVEKRIQALDTLAPSIQVLISKSIKISLMVIAFLVALNTTGVDLTALAVFGGALGVGLGFGLQKVVSNFVSGIILLVDQSIKPGDVIEIDGTYGQINKLAARYTSVITRNGTEYLIPNEDMITQSVINWSHSDTYVRRHIPIMISYEDDPRKAMDIMVEEASKHKRTLVNPAPVTRLLNFGDNGIELELRLWISDPQNGVANVASDVMLSIWDRFKEEGISFPFPQRVVYIKNESGHHPAMPQGTD